jgi:GT2 family glycosyltransferase
LSEEPGEIIAVDMRSCDMTRNLLKRHGVKIIVINPATIGSARKIGISNAAEHYIMFVDSDVTLGRGCLSTMKLELERNGWAVVQAQTRSWQIASYWQRCEDVYLSAERVGQTNQIGLAATLFRKETLLQCPIDPSFHTAEDLDISYRMRIRGLVLGISTAHAYHNHRLSFSGFFQQRYVHGLGIARLALKYRKISLLIGPLRAAASLTIRCALTRKAWMIPFYITSGAIMTAGVISGFTRLYGSQPSIRQTVQ